jgi:hypothetical protein
MMMLMFDDIKKVLIGKPLPTKALKHERFPMLFGPFYFS